EQHASSRPSLVRGFGYLSFEVSCPRWRMSVKARSHNRSGLRSPAFASSMILFAITCLTVVPTVKRTVAVSPLGAVGGKPTREHRIRVRSQRSERLQFPALAN